MLNTPEKLKKAYDTVMSFPEGVTVMRHLLAETGFNQPLLMLDSNTYEVNTTATIVNVAKRDLWMEIRKYLTHKQQYTLECPELYPEETPKPAEEPDNGS